MLEQAEQNRYNVINNGNGFYEVSPNELLTNLTISSKTTLHEDKEIINKTLTDITAIPAKDPASTMTDSLSLGVNGDFVSELLKMIVFPLIRPLFTPKVLFLLIINQKIMGGREDMPKDLNGIYDSLLNGIFCIIKDVIVKIKDALVEIFLDFIMKEIAPLIALFTSQLLLETLMMYHDLLMQILEKCLLNPVSAFFGQNLEGNIDDVNYADIIPVKTEPNQSIC
jgi:hypothetical protein